MRPDELRCAANRDCWAIGKQTNQGFSVRRVVWGRLLANEERRPDETIRRARILVRGERKRGRW
jgi:hypothetical protein